MANMQNRKFPFGFINNNQYATDLKKPEATDINTLDADRLALGTLEKSAYFDGTEGPKDWTGVTTPVVLNGRKFRLSSGILEFEETPGGNLQPVNAGTNPPTPLRPVGAILTSGSFSPNPAPFDGAGAEEVTFSLQTGLSYSGQFGVSFEINIDPNTSTFRWRLTSDTPGFYRQTGLAIDNVTPVPLNYGNVQVLFSTATVPLGETATSTINGTEFADGEYTYLMVNVQNDQGAVSIEPDENIESLPSEKTTITLNNFNETGDRVSNFIPQITFPVSLDSYTDEMWLFRKGPDEDTFIRVARYDGTDIFVEDGTTDAGTNVYEDTLQTVTITNLFLLQSEQDEGFAALNAAIGNPAGTFTRLFEKDNRLWLVPTDRPDLILYSRAGDWWGWQRANSFSFTGNITDTIIIRDPTTVGGTFTTVMGTENGIFHITGDGSQGNPYVNIQAVRDIFVEDGSMVDANGIIMLMSRSSNNGYDTGPYGQKAYEYNLQNLKEVSQRVKNSDAITSGMSIEFAQLRGSDKYFIKRSGIAAALVYHRDAQGWVNATESVEGTGLWSWQSKSFTPIVFQRFKIEYARYIKVEYSGQITIEFFIKDADGNLTSLDIFEFPNVGANTVEEIQRLPNGLDRQWTFQIKAEVDNTILYNHYFVQ